MPYQDEVQALAPLMSFDPIVFKGDDRTPQSVCNLVLALAVAYNDLRDVIFARVLLDESRPKGQPQICREFGFFGGLEVCLLKASAGVVHETLKLIERHAAAADHPFFRRVVRQCTSEARGAWEDLRAAARGQAHATPVSRALMLMRNKVAFHYDPKPLWQAFQECFPGTDGAMQPCVSVGDSMRSTRFYFADRCVERYLESHEGPDREKLIVEAGRVYIAQINSAFWEIITQFVSARGGSWRPLSIA